MCKRCLQIIFLIFVFSIINKALHAQWTGIVKYEVGVSAGAFIYQGDLTPSDLGSYKTIRPVFGISGSRILNRAFGLRANLAIGGLRADESKYSHPEYRQQRNFASRSFVAELTVQAVWNPLGRNYEDKGLTPYVFGGVGASYINTTRDWSRLNTDYFAENSDMLAGLAVDVARSTPKFIPVVPVGIGLRYAITPKIAVNAETNYRVTFTDYIDGFSYSANPDKRDHYHSHTIGVIYRFGRKNTLNCPVVRP